MPISLSQSGMKLALTSDFVAYDESTEYTSINRQRRIRDDFGSYETNVHPNLKVVSSRLIDGHIKLTQRRFMAYGKTSL